MCGLMLCAGVWGRHGRECVLVDAGKTMRDAVMRSEHTGTRSSIETLPWGLASFYCPGVEGGGQSILMVD